MSRIPYKSAAPRVLTCFGDFCPKCVEAEWNFPSADSQGLSVVVTQPLRKGRRARALYAPCPGSVAVCSEWGTRPARLRVGVGGWVSGHSVTECREPDRPAVVSYTFSLDDYITPSLCDPPITSLWWWPGNVTLVLSSCTPWRVAKFECVLHVGLWPMRTWPSLPLNEPGGK